MHTYIYARRRRNLAILRIITINFFGFSNAAFIFFIFHIFLDFTFSHLLDFTFSNLLDFTFLHLLDFWALVFFIFPFWVSFSVIYNKQKRLGERKHLCQVVVNNKCYNKRTIYMKQAVKIIVVEKFFEEKKYIFSL